MNKTSNVFKPFIPSKATDNEFVKEVSRLITNALNRPDNSEPDKQELKNRIYRKILEATRNYKGTRTYRNPHEIPEGEIDIFS